MSAQDRIESLKYEIRLGIDKAQYPGNTSNHGVGRILSSILDELQNIQLELYREKK